MTNRLSRVVLSPGQSPRNHALLAAAVFAVASGSLSAQLQFADSARGSFPPWFVTGNLVPGDFDGDGDIDLVSPWGPQRFNLLRNDGFGRFRVESPSPAPAITTTRVAVGDVDGDGDLDLVVAVAGGQNQLFLNDGSGAFTEATLGRMPPDVDRTRVVVLGDVDGDGDLDIICANDRQQSRLYLNSGLHSGIFVDATNGRMPLGVDATVHMALGDVDGDGDLDLVVCNGTEGVYRSKYLHQNRLYLNDGSGSFVDVTATHLPASVDPSQRVILGDVDGDGDLDLFVVQYAFWWYHPPNKYGPGSWSRIDVPNHLLLNNGAGVFSRSTGQQPIAFDEAHDLVCVDVDGDHDLDVITSRGGLHELLVNDGAGGFQVAPSRIPRLYGEIVVADIDGDGDFDLVKMGSWSVRGLKNRSGQIDASHPLKPGQPYAINAYLRDTSSIGGLALPLMAFVPAVVPLGPLGTLGVDPGTAVSLPWIQVSTITGEGALQMLIPSVPALVGLDLFSQALLLPIAGQPRLSNVLSDRLVEDANLVVNGGFELMTAGANPAPIGWTSLSPCLIAAYSSGSAMAGQRYVMTRYGCTSGATSFYQDVPTTPGRSYVLSLGYGPTHGSADNRVRVDWNGGTALNLQQDGTEVYGALWSVHRAVVFGAPGASVSRLAISDAGGPAGFGGNVDEVAVTALDFRTAIQVTGEIVLDSVRFQPLRAHLQQAAIAAANNNAAAKTAALMAFMASVNALAPHSITAGDAAFLVAIAGAL